MMSFVIPAHNEELYLGKTLDRLIDSAEAVKEPYEIIVAADGCTDDTTAVARKHKSRVIEVQLRQIAAVRNAGAKAARGDLLIFVDADTLIPRETLEAAVKAVRGGVIGGGCRAVIDPPVPWPMQLILRPLVCLFFRSWRFTLGGFIFATRSAFEAVGGFDERYFATEDARLCRALRKKGRFVVLREPMITSGRKMEQVTFWQGTRLVARLLLRGSRAFRQREGLEIWYEQRHSGTATQSAHGGHDPSALR